VRRTLLLAFFFLAANAHAITLLRNGEPVKGEICRFRAGDRENPFRRWLASGDVICDAGDAFPKGLWNVFARSDGALSTAPLLVEGSLPETLTLDAAATVIAQLPPNSRGVLYAPRLGSAFPAADKVLVPANETLWLFVIEKKSTIAVVPIAPIEAGHEAKIDARAGGPPAVIGWVRFPDHDESVIRNARSVLAPSVFARVDRATRDADLLPPLTVLHGAFIRIQNVPPGDGEIVSQGRGWSSDHQRMRVEGALTLVESPLTIRAVATIIVAWSTSNDLIALDHALGGCGDDQKAERGEISLSTCAKPARPTDPIDPSSCSVVRKEPFDPLPKYGSITFDDVTPGFYRAELTFGKLPPAATTTTVAAMQQVRATITAQYEELYGSVTRGGEPLGEKAVITFPGGGYGFADETTSDYRAVVRGRNVSFEADMPIRVKACDGDPNVLVLIDKFHRPNTRLDIDIPDNSLLITVNDTFTREPLPGTAIQMDVMSLSLPPRPTVASRKLKTGPIEDDESKVVVRSVPPDRSIVLRVSRPGYQKQNVEPFSLTKSESKEVHVQLVPLRGSQGRLVSAQPFEDATIAWYRDSGTETERIDVAPDGSFTYEREHTPEEAMIVVSASHPLWVGRSPEMRGQKGVFAIRFPDNAPVRAFDLPQYATLVVGGIRVPNGVLRQHQTLHHNTLFKVTDVAETGAVEVVR